MGRTTEEMVAFALIFLILPLVVVALRFYSRGKCHKQLKFDCWALLLAVLLNTGMCLCVLLGATVGNLGEHENGTSNFQPEKQAYYALNILYPLANGLIKLALVFLYRRILLPFTQSRVFNAVSFTFVFIIALWSLAFALASIFLCDPVAASWDEIIPSGRTDATCMPGAFFDTLQITDLVTAIMVLALPVPATLSKMLFFPRRKRVAVCITFMIGVFVVVAGAVRLCYFLIQGSSSYDGADASYDAAPISYWAIIQTSVGICCACLPCLGPLVGLQELKPGSVDAERVASEEPLDQPRIEVTDAGKSLGVPLRSSEITSSDKTRGTSQASWPSAVWPLPPSIQATSPMRAAFAPQVKTQPPQPPKARPTKTNEALDVPARAPSAPLERSEAKTAPPQRTLTHPVREQPVKPSSSEPQRIGLQRAPVPVRAAQYPQRSASQRAPTTSEVNAQPPQRSLSKLAEASGVKPQWPERSTSNRLDVNPVASHPQTSAFQLQPEQASVRQPPHPLGQPARDLPQRVASTKAVEPSNTHPQRTASKRTATEYGSTATSRQGTPKALADSATVHPQRTTSRREADHAASNPPIPQPPANTRQVPEPQQKPSILTRKPSETRYPIPSYASNVQQPAQSRRPSDGQGPPPQMPLGHGKSAGKKRRTGIVQIPPRSDTATPTLMIGGHEVKVQRDSHGGMGTFFAADADSDEEVPSVASSAARGVGRAV